MNTHRAPVLTAMAEPLVEMSQQTMPANPRANQKPPGKILRPRPYKPKKPTPPRDQSVLEEYDPLFPPRVLTQTNYPQEMRGMAPPLRGRVFMGEGARYVLWTLTEDLDTDRAGELMELIRARARNAFVIRYNYAPVIRNIEDNRTMVFYQNKTTSRRMNSFEQAAAWLEEKERERLNPANITRPNTKWVFERFSVVEVKIILERGAPLVGTGPLPQWLKNRARTGGLVSLDTYNDNLCFWRCLAVHEGVRSDRSTTRARALLESYLGYPA